jgi:two-component system, OmpR family, sensor histidine kinase VicK
MDTGQNTASPNSRASLGSLGPVVLMIVVLFAAMVIAGITLNHQINVLEANGQGLDWAREFNQANRLLLVVLAVASFALVSLLTFLLWNLRRYTDGNHESVSELLRQKAALESLTKQLETDLASERAQLKSLLNNMQEGVIFSENKYVRYTNRAFARLSGYSAEELIGKRLASDNGSAPLESDLGRLHETVSGAIALGGMWQGPYTIHSRDGEELDVAVIGTSVISPSNGHGSQIMTLIRDASQEKRLQAQKTSFVSNASHELRTPLSNMKMRVYLLRKQPEKMEEHLQVLENVTNYMQQLIDEMLDMGRFERGVVILERENGVLQDLVTEAVRGFKPRAERRAVALNCDVPEEPIPVMVDHKRIVQVLTNLVANAMNHTPQNGLIEVSVNMERSQNPDRFVRIEVRDNGIGIPADVLAQVFQPFSMASQGAVSGTVLGLSLAKEIIELHGGTIEVESEVGHGAVYTICLPILTVK